MIPYGKQNIDRTDINAVLKVLKSDWLTQGPKVLEFEKALVDYCGAKYAVALSNGTAGLHLAYLAIGLKAGDEIIITANTFAATANMILAVGAKPVFCDIRLDTYNIDESKIEALITSKTKAIVPVHFAGQACAMDEILKIAGKYKLAVVEDACHALGARYKKNRIGSLKTNMTVFSFHPVKGITTGEGGAVITNNKKYYEKLKLLQNHGIYKDKKGKNVMVELGFNYRITDLQAALGISQLKKLGRFIKARRQVVKWYEKELKGLADIILPLEATGNFSAWHIYVIRVKKSSNRDKLAFHLKNNGIAANFHYPAVYSQPYYRHIGYNKVKLKNEKTYASSCLTLPGYVKLSRKEVKYVCDKIKAFYEKK